MLATGLRRGEALALHWRDVDLDAGMLRVRWTLTRTSKGLAPGDRVLFFTDGVVEERLPGGEQFGGERLRDLIERTTAADLTCAETVRRLSHALMAARSGRTGDDASLLVLEWKGPPREDELDRDIPEATPSG